MISFWSKLVRPVKRNISTKLFFIAKTHFEEGIDNASFKWFDKIRNILISCGFSGFWDSLNFPNSNWLVKSIKQKLTDLYINNWQNETSNSTSCYNYRIFKTTFGYESYRSKVPFTYRKYLIKIRTRNHNLPIETGRWRRILRENRKCHLCIQDIGDKYHYLMSCKRIHNLRKQYLKSYFCSRPSTFKFQQLMNCKNMSQLRKLSLFIKFIFSTL